MVEKVAQSTLAYLWQANKTIPFVLFPQGLDDQPAWPDPSFLQLMELERRQQLWGFSTRAQCTQGLDANFQHKQYQKEKVKSLKNEDQLNIDLR